MNSYSKRQEDEFMFAGTNSYSQRRKKWKYLSFHNLKYKKSRFIRATSYQKQAVEDKHSYEGGVGEIGTSCTYKQTE